MFLSLKKLSNIDRFINIFYLVLLVVYFFFHAISKTVFFVRSDIFHNIVSTTIRVCIIIILLIAIYHIATFEFSKRYTIIFLIVFGILFAQYYISRDGSLLFFYCFMICAKNYNSTQLMKLLFAMYLFSFSFVLIGGFIGVFPSTSLIRSTGKVRYSLGFWVPNVSSYYLVILTSLFILIKNVKLGFKHFFVLIIINIVFYKLTDTKNGLFTSMITITLAIVAKYVSNKLIRKVIVLVSYFSFLFCSIIPFLLTYWYSKYPEKLANLNYILSGRLSLQLTAIKKYGVPLFGSLIVHDAQKYDVIDSSYFSLLLTYGILIFIFMILFFTFETYLSNKTNNIWLSICLLTLAYYSTFDTPLLSTINNPYSIFIFENILMLYPNAYSRIFGRDVVKVL